jgi:hypothetical protein
MVRDGQSTRRRRTYAVRGVDRYVHVGMEWMHAYKGRRTASLAPHPQHERGGGSYYDDDDVVFLLRRTWTG